jgi:acetyltransferase-like isoleucine patch superfamily enzyme
MRITTASIQNVKFGENVHVIEPVNLYGCELASGVFIGPFVEIQSNVKIGANTKIQSHTFICSLVEIKQNCFIGHSVVFINDKFCKGSPARGDENLWESTTVGNNVHIGSNATILPVKICDDVIIGAGAVVTKDITEPGFYVGNPCRKLKGR